MILIAKIMNFSLFFAFFSAFSSYLAEFFRKTGI